MEKRREKAFRISRLSWIAGQMVIWMGFAGFPGCGAHAAELSFPAGAAVSGGSVKTSINYHAQGAVVSGLQFDLSLDPAVFTVTAEAGSATIISGKSLYTQVMPNGSLRFLLLGMNQNSITDGSIADLTIRVNSSAPTSLYMAFFSGVFGTDPDSGSVSVTAADGQIRIRARSKMTWDADADGSTDVAAFHLASDQFFSDYAGNMGQYGWEKDDCYPIVWDYNGDGATDVSIYHIPTNQWFVKGYPGDNLGQYGWGGDESVPVPGDYNGDGVVEQAFYHWPTNRWFIAGQDPVPFGWGGADSVPIAADYDGNGTTDLMLYHVPTNQWFVYGVGNLGQFGWNGSECIPVPGDWDGDGRTEIGIYHWLSNSWFWRNEDGTTHFLGQYGWGGAQSFPIPGDYNGDGVMERAFYRPADNWWFIEGEPDFIWGYGGAEFMPITSQMTIYNWFRFGLGKFQ